jgi:two-component system, OmpR family, sensor histidine kinase CiaH
VAATSTDRLLRRTRLRLFATTLALLTLLVVGVGAATIVVATSSLDADLDRALEAAVRAQVTALDGELPSGEEQSEGGEHSPAVADTVLLVLDANGEVLLNRTGQALPGLPDAVALAGAGGGLDVRTIATDGVKVRVLTMPVLHDGAAAGFVQGGFDLTLHDQQARSLVLAVLVVGALGLVAAAAIAYVVTGRALVPIREGFEAQRRFVADASHELRTPAALIRANAEVLEREGLVIGDGSALVSDIIGEADRLGGLVGDLLQLAAWDETTLALSPVELDVASLAADTVRGATALAAERGVGLEVDVTGPAPTVADRDRLTQLLLILVDNAIDHSPAGETITVRVRQSAGDVVIDVDDRGPGIPPAERERIFEPFTRLSGTTRHGSGGTGLGLAIARRIVDAHGGTIRADSPAGGGARFTVTLPGPDGRSSASGTG